MSTRGRSVYIMKEFMRFLGGGGVRRGSSSSPPAEAVEAEAVLVDDASPTDD